MKHVVFAVLILSLALLPAAAFALELNLDYPRFPGAPDINNLDCSSPEANCLTTLVAWFYALIVGLSGLTAFAMIVWGGVQWMTSAGNPAKTQDAKDRIQKALLGLLLILASFLILQVINPELIQFQEPG